jgi:2'-5' RNA ligase superfamily
MGAAPLVRHHATVLLDPERSKPVEKLRSRWDPQMAQQIAAHVTLIYPEKVADPAQLDEVVRAAVARTAPFRVALGAWRSVAATHLRTEFVVTNVATTASDGNRWRTVKRLPLTGRPA